MRKADRSLDVTSISYRSYGHEAFMNTFILFMFLGSHTMLLCDLFSLASMDLSSN